MSGAWIAIAIGVVTAIVLCLWAAFFERNRDTDA